jgi:hypothetical protein
VAPYLRYHSQYHLGRQVVHLSGYFCLR